MNESEYGSTRRRCKIPRLCRDFRKQFAWARHDCMTQSVLLGIAAENAAAVRRLTRNETFRWQPDIKCALRQHCQISRGMQGNVCSRTIANC